MEDKTKLQQQRFFEILKKRTPRNKKLIPEIMELLSIQKGAAYKRINGTTALSLSELITLSEHYNLSLDSIYSSEKFITFEHPFVHQNQVSQETFINQYKYFIEPLKSQSEKKKLVYLANELPVFYYFGHKYIFSFLMHVWSHLHWDETGLKISNNEKYDALGKSFSKEIIDNYYSNDVTEIWNSNMLNNLYQKIIFCVTIRAFKDAQFIHQLINDISLLIHHLRDISVTGVKSNKGSSIEGSSLKIYLNDFGSYLNMVVYESENIKATFVGYDYPQFIISHNSKFYEFSTDWISKLKKRSVLISTEGFQYRELFFIKMETDFKNFKTQIENLLKIYYHNES